jgi:Domain of unknown function (DUF222)/HNH endonuclease
MAAIERFRQRPRANRPPEVLAAEMIQERHAIDLLELDFSENAGCLVESGEEALDGSASHIDWIRHSCKMSSSTAADRVSVGEQLANLPASAQAVADGEIGFAHLSVIARAASALAASKTAAPFDEHLLLDAAREMSVGRLWHLARHVRHAADPEGVATDEAFAVERRWLRLSTSEDGSVLIGGQLDPAGGAALRSALDPLARPSGADDDRGHERRYADALVELVTHSLDSGQLPQRGTQRPHLQVTTTLETLRGLPGSPAGEMEFSLPVCSKTVQRLACDSTITRVVLGSDSVVIDVGRAKRVVSGPTRRALNARDGHCQWPGCDRPPSWSAAHHVVHWARDGSTDLSNLILLCHRHHWCAHEGGWQLVRTDDGRLLTIPPPWLAHLGARVPDTTAAA